MKRVIKIIVAIVIIVIVVGTFVLLWKKSQPTKTNYEQLTVVKDSIENTTVATGKISPRDEILIKPQISGIISKVLVQAGDHVKFGDILATVKVIPEMTSLNSAESRVNVAKISLNLVKAQYERQEELFKKGVISKDEMDQSLADYKKALEELDNSKDNLEIIKNGMSKKTEKYSNTNVRSTITGIVLDVPIKQGSSVIQANTFNEGTTIATVADMNDMIFTGKVDETEVGRVHLNMPIKLTIGALADKKFDATLEYIAPKGNEENGATLFEIRAAAHIPDSIVVRSGYSANAEIVLDKVKSVLTIPERAVSFENDSAFVYVADTTKQKTEYKKQPIKIGLSDGIKIEVKSGLKLGNKVRGNVIDPKAKNNTDK